MWSPNAAAPNLTGDDVLSFFDCLARAAEAGPLVEIGRPTAVRFKLGAAGSWRLCVSPTDPGTLDRDPDLGAPPEPAACTLSCALDVLLDLANGRRKPVGAYSCVSTRRVSSLHPRLLPSCRAHSCAIRPLPPRHPPQTAIRPCPPSAPACQPTPTIAVRRAQWPS